jgi:hypothetical protein
MAVLSVYTRQEIILFLAYADPFSLDRRLLMGDPNLFINCFPASIFNGLSPFGKIALFGYSFPPAGVRGN